MSEERELEDHIADVLDGTAPDELLDRIAESEQLRDLRFDAERAVELVRDTGSDHVPPTDLEQRLLQRLDAGDGPSVSSGERAPTTQRIGTEQEVQQPAAAAAAESTDFESSAGDSTDEGSEQPSAPATSVAVAASAETAAPRTEPMPAAEAPAPAQPEVDTLPSADHAKPAPRAEAPRARRPLEKPRSQKRPLGLIIGGLATVAAAAAAAIAFWPSAPTSNTPTQGWSAEVLRIDGPAGGLVACAEGGNDCQPVEKGKPVSGGALVKTDGATRAGLTLSDGSKMVLDRNTQLQLSGSESRRAKLLTGALVADVEKKEQTARIDLPTGYAEVLGTKFAVRVSGKESATVDVSRGAVKLADAQERSVTVRAGEEGRMLQGVPPFASSAPALGEALAWGESVTGQLDDSKAEIRGLGELRAKKPGEKDERTGAVTLTSHKVKVRIVDNVARTEIEEVFSNQTDEVLEGIYRFPLPPGAQIERLALEVDGKLEEGAFVDRTRAAAIWRGTIVNAAPKLKQQIKDEIIWVPGPWKDPALLEWQRGGRFELRIYPIPKKGARRVVLAYTQVLQPTGGVRRYTYPLAHDPSGSTQVASFDVDVQVKGHDRRFAVQSHGYPLQQAEGSGDAERLTLNRSQFRPSGDLVIEYALPARDAELKAWAYKPSAEDLQANQKKTQARQKLGKKTRAQLAGVDPSAAYVAFAVRPKLPRVEEGVQRDFAIVVDASRSMFGERYERAQQLATGLVRELDEGDRVTVLACDTTCQRLPGGMMASGASTAAQASGFLESVTPEGGSDVAASIAGAQRALGSAASGRQQRIVFIGDGTPTVGPVLPNYVEKSVKRSLRNGNARITSVAIGADADAKTLGSLARAGGGVMLPYVPGQRTSEAVFGILGASYGAALKDIQITLPSGLKAVAPTRLDPIPAGGEQLVVARLDGDRVDGNVKLTGFVGGQRFEREYPIAVQATSKAGNAFVPRLYAATRLAELERIAGKEAKAEAVELSQTFNVASRHTSLLVLESPAMFKAFGLDNTRAAPTWTGEESAETAVAELQGEDDAAFDFDDEAAGAGLGAIGGSARGGGGFSEGKKKASAPRASRPAPKPAPSPRPSRPSGPGEFAEPIAPPNDSLDPFDPLTPSPPRRWRPPPRRRMVPMRRIFERTGVVSTDNLIPKIATPDLIAAAEREMESNPNRRAAVKKFFQLLSVSGNVQRAKDVAERWSAKDPLDPEALTARADILAREGRRQDAIRLLGSVIDVRPDDVKAQKRLARLHRWAGKPEQGCRYSLAIAQLKGDDAKLMAEAIRCARETGMSWMGDEMLDLADKQTKRVAEALLKQKSKPDTLSGDFRVEVNWAGNAHDLDLAILHPDGHRASWLGAPTREVITATSVRSTSQEGLALRGATPGEYLVEVVRGSGTGPVSGTVNITVGKARRSVPFTLTADRSTVARIQVKMESRLVPARGRFGGWR